MGRRRWARKEANDLEDQVIAAGGEVHRTGTAHMRVVGPAGSVILGVTVSNKRYGGRGWANAYSQVRRHTGLELRRRRAG